MGSIAKALSRANYLKPVADSINQLIQRRQYEQGLQQLASMLSGGEQNIKDIYSGTKEQKTAVPTGRPLSPLSGLANQSTNVPTQTEDLANIPTLPMEELRIETNHVPKYTPQEQDQLAQGELFNIQKELITNKNIDPAKGGQVVSAIQQLINAQQPKKKQLKGINTTDDVYDEYGNLVKRGTPKEKTTKEKTIENYEKDEKGNAKIYKVEGQNYYKKIKLDDSGKPTGDEELVRVPNTGEGKNTTNIYMPGETGLTPDTGKLIANIKNFDPYVKDSDGNYIDKNGAQVTKDSDKVRMSDTDIKYAKDKTLENIKLQIFKKTPRAYQWVNHINKIWKDKGGSDYISPEDLNDEAIKHVKDGNLKDSDAKEIASFIKYYEQIYDGLTK